MRKYYKVNYWFNGKMHSINVLAYDIPEAYKKARAYLKKEIENIYEVIHICDIDCE